MSYFEVKVRGNQQTQGKFFTSPQLLKTYIFPFVKEISISQGIGPERGLLPEIILLPERLSSA